VDRPLILLMQGTYIDRVIIKNDFNYCQLIIPTKKDFAATFFSGLGSLMFLVGIILFSTNLFSKSLKDTFTMLWLMGAFIGWISLTRVFLWNAIGKEVITIDNDIITIDRFWFFFFKPKIYDLRLVKNLRTDFDDNSYEESKWNNSILSSGKLNLGIRLGGTFSFDYNEETIKFGDSVDKDDADWVLEKIKEAKLLSHANLSL